MSDQRIGFIGAGQMGRALASGFVRAGLVAGERIFAFDPNPAVTAQLVADIPGASLADSNQAVVDAVPTVFLSVKPQIMEKVLGELAGTASQDTLFVSIAAGIPLTKLTAWLGSTRVIRVMPNTPCLVGMSAAGYCSAAGATQEDRKLVADLLGSAGMAVELDERLMDALTGLSGSGPAYVYTFIEALSDGGVKMGLPRDVATALAIQTVRGAAEMVLVSGEHTAVLRDRVTSPGGTTIAGLTALEQGGLRATIVAAVEAATRRSHELGNG